MYYLIDITALLSMLFHFFGLSKLETILRFETYSHYFPLCLLFAHILYHCNYLLKKTLLYAGITFAKYAKMNQ